MNPPHKYNTRHQAKVQAIIQEKIKESKELYQRRTYELEWQEHFTEAMRPLFKKNANANTRKERVETMIEIMEKILQFPHLLMNGCHTPNIMMTKINQFRESIKQFRTDPSMYRDRMEMLYMEALYQKLEERMNKIEKIIG